MSRRLRSALQKADRVLHRAVLVFFGYIAAVFTSAAAYQGFFLFWADQRVTGTGTLSSGVFLTFLAFAFLFALPALCITVIAEERSYRIILYYALSWAVAAVVIGAIPPLFPDIGNGAFSRFKLLFWGSSGLIGGCVYWLIAGRFVPLRPRSRRHEYPDNKFDSDQYWRR